MYLCSINKNLNFHYIHIQQILYCQNYQINLRRKKGLRLFSQTLEYDQDKPKREEIVFDDFIKNIACPFDEEKLNLSDKFWENYEELKKPVKANKASYN